ncbi:MAG: von Willebrand factor type A domain-containing protein, partial [Anaerolineaceae bacterium]|nr:von Willebrand factor type A domain-containing protein [Anaerolineaceae bacterium]
MKTRWFFKMFLLLSLSSLLLSACGILLRSADSHSTKEVSVESDPALQSTGELAREENALPAEAPTAKEAAEDGGQVGGAEMETLVEPMDAEEGFMQPMPTLAPPNGDPYRDNFFENYGVNPMVDTDDDHYSTFAIDVDTGSYTVARRYLNDGYLPEKDAVRVEEFVNYFEQGYRLPPEGQAFRIALDGGAAPFTETEKYQILRVGLQGYAVPAEEREDVSLTFVIDVSGSMDMENRLELVK